VSIQTRQRESGRNEADRPRRVGVSTIEIIACTATLLVGLVAGLAMLNQGTKPFVGQSVATAETNSAETSGDGQPEQDRSDRQHRPERLTATSEVAAKVLADEVKQLRAEVSRLRRQASQSAPANQAQSPDTQRERHAARRAAVEPPPEQAAGPDGRRTLAYWNGLNEIIVKETAMRAPPAKLTVANIQQFLQNRDRAASSAAEAIGRLPTEGVDPAVLSLARDLAAWYQQGVQNNDQAGSLLGADVATRRGAAGRSWSQDERQHRNQVDQINQRGEQVRQAMTAKYGMAFPKLR